MTRQRPDTSLAGARHPLDDAIEFELPLDAAGVVAAWERSAALDRPWAELSVLALATARSIDELARLPIGRRDELLLRLHGRLFGDEIECEATCPSCGERLELTMRVGELLSGAGAETAGGDMRGADGWVTIAGRDVPLRLPDSLDVAAALEGRARGADPALVLLERCVREPALLHDEDARRAAEEMLAELDPMAELLVELACPTCATRWSESLDPAFFLLEAIGRRAERLLDEVDVLARAYGWPEREILAMSYQRRDEYLSRALA